MNKIVTKLLYIIGGLALCLTWMYVFMITVRFLFNV
jgi:hypothetical protein